MIEEPAHIGFLQDDFLEGEWEKQYTQDPEYGEGVELVNPALGTRLTLFPDREVPVYRLEKEEAEGVVDESLNRGMEILEENFGYRKDTVREVVL